MDMSRLTSIIRPTPRRPVAAGAPPTVDISPPPEGRWKYLQPSDLRRLRNLQFAAKLVVEGFFQGRHRSPFHDFSSEFADYRQYVPGDEIRAIDWRAYARTDRYYIKLYRKETDMTCCLLLDNSKSMSFAGDDGVSKLEYAHYMAAALAYLIVKQGDNASLAIGDDNLRAYVPAGRSQRHLQQVLSTLEQNAPGGGTGLSTTLESLFGVLKRRGLLIVISDFLDDPERIFSALSMYTHRGFTVLLFQVLTDDELHLPQVENALFTDMESPLSIAAEPELVRGAYELEIQRFLDTIAGHAKARQIYHRLTTTSTPYHKALESYLTTRKAAGQ